MGGERGKCFIQRGGATFYSVIGGGYNDVDGKAEDVVTEAILTASKGPALP